MVAKVRAVYCCLLCWVLAMPGQLRIGICKFLPITHKFCLIVVCCHCNAWCEFSTKVLELEVAVAIWPCTCTCACTCICGLGSLKAEV